MRRDKLHGIMSSIDSRAVTRVTLALMLAQSLASGAYSSAVAVNQLAMVEMMNNRTWAGVPTAIVLLGSSIMAYIAGKLVGQIGRRYTLTLGGLFGFVGAMIAGVGVATQQVWVFAFGLFVLGWGRAILEQSRYAAVEVNPPDRRARALSYVVWGATIGAVGAPLIAPFADDLGVSYDLHRYSGPLFATAFFYIAAAIVLFLLLSIDWKSLVERVSSQSDEGAKPKVVTSNRSFIDTFRFDSGARAATVAMACGQASMALMMSCVSIYMKDHNHTLGEVSAVISTHTLGMFAFSPLVGQLADRFGRRPVIVAGVLILISGCVIVPLSIQTPIIALGEFLVGLGWSACYVSGSTLLTDVLGKAERARLQGANDSVVQISTAIGSLSSGPLLAFLGIVPLAFVGMVVALTPLLFVLRAPTAPKPALETK